MAGQLWITVVAAIVQAAAPLPAASFCQRMAAELPMKKKRVVGVTRAFDLQTLNVAQRWIVGGSTSFSMRLEPVNHTPEEEQRLDRMCDASPCTMEGPFKFRLGLKDGTKHEFEALPGERARVEMVGTRIRCSDL